MKLIFLVLVLTLGACSHKKKLNPNTCLSSREFITTMEFIRDQKDFALKAKDAEEISHKVSTGCTGSSKRFVQVTLLLVKAGFPSKVAMETGLTYALNDDASFEAFMSIFKSSYLETLLDLSLEQSLSMARDLSLSFKGNKKFAKEEFTKLVDFCVKRKSLDLPLMDCALKATRIVKSSEEFEFKVGDDFISLFNYLTSKNDLNLTTMKALEVAESVTKYGPEGKKNFIEAYEYGISKTGMDLSTNDSIEFGKIFAARSVRSNQLK